LDLRGAVVIVTGSSRGIGRATAIEFGRKEAKVVVNYLKRRKEAEETVKAVRDVGGEAVIVQGDVGKWEDSKRIVESALKSFGTVDVLVNNAGVYWTKEFSKANPDDWLEMFRVNVIGVMNMCRHVIPILIEKRRGAIINVSSVIAIKPPSESGAAIYSASKAALIGFTKALARELAPYNVRVSAIAPGLVRTEMALTLGSPEELAKWVPLGRIAEPEEIAKAIVFLAEHDYITGEVLVVAGGE